MISLSLGPPELNPNRPRYNAAPPDGRSSVAARAQARARGGNAPVSATVASRPAAAPGAKAGSGDYEQNIPNLLQLVGQSPMGVVVAPKIAARAREAARTSATLRSKDAEQSSSSATESHHRPRAPFVLPGTKVPVTMSYQPVWYAGKKAVTTFQTELWMEGEARATSVDRLLATNGDTGAAWKADAILLQKAIADLKACLDQGKKSVVSVPLHYRAIADKRGRSQILSSCMDAPPNIRKLLVFDLLGVDSSDGKTLSENLEPFRKMGRSITVRIGLKQRIDPDLSTLGVHAVGCDLRDETLAEGECLAELEQFAAKAQRAGIGSYAYGLRSRSLVIAAVCAGFDYIGGDAVVANVTSPQGVFSFEPLDLYLGR